MPVLTAGWTALSAFCAASGIVRVLDREKGGGFFVGSTDGSRGKSVARADEGGAPACE